MHPEPRVRLSKFLSLILRHRPERVGLTLDRQGRVPLAALVAALRAQGWDDLRVDEIEEVVRLDGRGFAIDASMIRARYGHLLTLEQPGSPARPPEWLYYAVPVTDLEVAHVMTVFAQRAHDRGILFYQVTDRLYLAPRVPPEFLPLPACALVAGPG